MGELLLEILSRSGPVGVVLCLAYLYTRQLHKEITVVQSKRVEDSKAMVDKLLELNDKWSETLNAQAEVSEGQKQALVDLRQLLMMEHIGRRDSKY